MNGDCVNVKTLKAEDMRFASTSIVDECGKVFFYDGRVFRAVFSPADAKHFTDILSTNWINELFEEGLVRTWICRDFKIPGVSLILEHQRFSYFLHPSEYTSSMFWDAAKKIVRINNKLSQHGYGLKDGHSWNIMYFKGQPYYIDFGSIVKADVVPVHWHEEYRKYYGIPVWLGSSKRWNRLSREYRRENTVGFGLAFFDSNPFKYIATRSLNNIQKYCRNKQEFFCELDKWLEEYKPLSATKEYWSSYDQTHETEDPLSPRTVKQKFVYEILSQEKPNSVLDCAANKGFYSEMAAKLGASVASFDYEEHCVDACIALARNKKLDITPAVMDFRLPTPGYGFGLSGPTAIERFQSEIILALGLTHHLCIAQGMPVELFCDIISKYAKKGIVLEYVDPSDKHVRVWKKPIPRDYSLEQFIKFLSGSFPNIKKRQIFSEDGVCRHFLYFEG